MNFVHGLLDTTVTVAIPLALAACGGLMAERAGVFNIGLEGMMLVGAFVGVVASYYTHSAWPGIVAAPLAGAALGALLGGLCVSLRGDQIVVGIMLNILALGLTSLLFRAIFGLQGQSGTVAALHPIRIPGLADIPYLGQALFDQDAIAYLAYLIVIGLTVFLFRTPGGMRWRSAGDAPSALEAAGVSVVRMRYMAVLVSGALAGLAGAHLTLGETPFFSDGMTNGRGFIALGAVIVGRWNPVGALLAALLFGVAQATQLQLQASGVDVPYQLLGMLPYVLTIAVLAGAAGRSHAPRFVGRPYIKGE
ncbi:MAG TPA: ABC transporter permease [Solirubrobacterales bacterium]|jgi:simple sugar transport system permease protein|nr:ABC transporter permease [Solirubrobacterales bacterium]